jgi:hypothetical protein
VTRRLPWLILFGVAMGLLEAAVVVYLRELFYPEGFRFPLVPLPMRIGYVELVRELCTLAMLWAVAALCRRSRLDGFFVFAFLFGVWDLVYYAGLYLFIGWPESPMTWDVLFLIPVTWAAPVLYPALIALAMVVGFPIHDRLMRGGRPIRPSLAEWIVAVTGALVLIISFCWKWREVNAGIVPESFPLWIYLPGFALGIGPFVRAAVRARRGDH